MIRVGRLLVVWAINTGALMLLAWVLPGFSIESWAGGLALAALLGLLNALVWPLLIRIALPLAVHHAGTGRARAERRVRMARLGRAVRLRVDRRAVDRDRGRDRADARQQRGDAVPRDRRRRSLLPPGDQASGAAQGVCGSAERHSWRALPGDRRARPRRARAGDAGRQRADDGRVGFATAPTGSSSGSATGRRRPGRCSRGSCRARTGTCPASAGGRRTRQDAFVSNSPKNAAEIEQRHTNGKGLLYADGASRANLVSGDAPHSMITMSTLREKREGRLGQDYLAFFSNPYDVTRTFILVVKEIVAELWQQTQQQRQDIEPRVHRGWFPYPFLASYTNVLQRELEVAATIQDLYSGRPVIYTMFLGYDEVAHHSGIERPETLRELAKIDKAFARLARAADDAPRPYHIVVLADHGQSQGATFKQRYGPPARRSRSTEKCGADEVLAPGGVDEGWGYLNAAATEVASAAGVIGAVTRRVTRSSTVDDGTSRSALPATSRAASAGSGRRRASEGAARGDRDGVGLPRPGLLPADRRVAQRSSSSTSYPGLVEGAPHPPRHRLRAVRSEQHGAVVLGPSGTNYLDEGAGRGRRPARAVRPERRAPCEANRHLPPLPGHHAQQHLLARGRRGRRLRRAVRLPRRYGRHPEPPVHPLPRRLVPTVERRSSAPRTSTSSSSTGSPNSATPPTPTCRTCPTGSPAPRAGENRTHTALRPPDLESPSITSP